MEYFGTLYIAGIAKDGIVVVCDTRISVTLTSDVEKENVLCYWDYVQKIYTFGNCVIAVAGKQEFDNKAFSISFYFNRFFERYSVDEMVPSDFFLKFLNFVMEEFPPEKHPNLLIELNTLRMIFCKYDNGEPYIALFNRSKPLGACVNEIGCLWSSDTIPLKTFDLNISSSSLSELLIKVIEDEAKITLEVGGPVMSILIPAHGAIKWINNEPTRSLRELRSEYQADLEAGEYVIQFTSEKNKAIYYGQTEKKPDLF
ncbi:MAG: hypothetical protein ABIN91_02535 [Mucilaginibacter sp.]|uniref:hypothetical protein n=1 Tax=Mucilaginibacter sp. TaxID=1882438 RepID=UPI00326491A2